MTTRQLISFIGSPGSGKGTQARLLKERAGVPTLSIGDLLRARSNHESTASLLTTTKLNSGVLIPDEIVQDCIREGILSIPNCTRIILDGFPRTRSQAVWLETFARETRTPRPLVVLFNIPRRIVAKRFRERLTCTRCGRTYGYTSCNPSIEAVCDDDGAALTRRLDDTLEAISRRLSIYEAEVESILRHYEPDQIGRVDAGRHPEEMFQELVCLRPFQGMLGSSL